MSSDACEWCGDVWDDQSSTHWNIDIRTDVARGERFVQWFPCCEGNRDDVDAFGYEAVHGRTVANVCEEILGLEVLEVIGEGEACVVRVHGGPPSAAREIGEPTPALTNASAITGRGVRVSVD